ncbi:MAG: dienelactone hydrolase family protein [Bacteroidia bacterium]|nr:dienelactone hydrolase family protein [Bacteroidia bacterium]
MRKVLSIILLLLQFTFVVQAQKVNTDLVYQVKMPAKGAAKAPVIILLHGYGSNETDLFDIANALDDRYIVFSVRAPFKGKEIGYSWYGLEFLPNKQLKHNFKEMKESRAKILSFISNACAAYKTDSTKVFVMGYSQGAIMAYDLALNAPKKVNGVLILSGMLPEEIKPIKANWNLLNNVKYFIAHGNSDNVIDIKEAEKAAAYLKEKGNKEVNYKNYEMPHALTGNELNDIKKWLKKQLDPAPKIK